MVTTVPTSDNSLISGVKQGQNLGVTEMASSEPGKEDEVLVAGLLNKLIEIPGIKPKIKEVISDEPEKTLINVKKTKQEKVVETPIADPSGKIEPTLSDEFDVDISIKKTEDETKFKLDTDAIDVDFDKIETPQDFQNVIQQYTDNLPTPNVQPYKQTELLAEELNIKPTLLQGQGFKSAEEVFAARTFIKQSGEYLLSLADDVLANPQDKVLQLKFKKQLTTHGLFVTQFRKGRANVGRALSAFRIPTIKDPADQAEVLDLLIVQQGGSKNIVKIAEQTKKLVDANSGDFSTLHSFVGDNFYERSSRAWSEAYRGGLLFSVKTQLRNVLGNALYLSYTIPEYTLAGIYGTVENAARGGANLVRGRHWGDGQGGMSWEVGAARLYGLANGFIDAFKVANKSFRTGQPSDAMSKYEGANSEYFTAKNLGLENSAFAGAIDFMGKVYRLPYAGLQYGDEFFKEVARSMEMHTLIMENANKIKGIENISFKEAVSKAINDIASRPDDFKKTLDESARYYTFQDQLPGSIEKYVTALQSTPYVGTIILPFAKTPVNVVRRANDITIGAFPKLFSKDQKTRTRAYAKFTMAGAAYIGISQMFAQGRITGGYPIQSNGKIDMKLKSALDARGWRPYSLVFAADDLPDGTPLYDENGMPTGDHIYVSYQGLEPIGALLGVAAHTMEIKHKSNDPFVRDNSAIAALYAINSYLNDMPMLEGMSDLFTALSSLKFNDFAKDTITSMVSAPMLPLAPVTGLGYLLGGENKEVKDEKGNVVKDEKGNVIKEFNIIKRNQDRDFERDMKLFLDNGKPNFNYGQPKDTRYFNSFIDAYNKFLYQLPYDEFVGSVGHYIWGKDKEGKELPPAYDIFGNPLIRSSEMGLFVDIMNTYFSPLGFKKVKDQPLYYHENQRLGGIINNPSKSIKGVKLTPQEYSDLIRYTKKTGYQKYDYKNFEDYIKSYMSTQAYRDMNDVEKIKNIKKIQSGFNELGREQLLLNNKKLEEDIFLVEQAIDRGIPLGNNIIEGLVNDSQ
jgi:hypothetical protein